MLSELIVETRQRCIYVLVLDAMSTTMIQLKVVQGNSPSDFAAKINDQLIELRGENKRIFSISYSTSSALGTAKLSFSSSSTWDFSEGEVIQFITGFIEYDDGQP
jgi:hypothetical protein